MDIMRKTKIQGFFAGLFAVALLTCTASAMSFPDVDSNSYYLPAITYVSKMGVMVGDAEGKFNPDQIVSRAEMATIVCRVLKQTDNLSKSSAFNDVPATHWANSYIGKASELGIVNGYGAGKFGPSDSVTYEQAVTMIVRAIGEESKANSYGGYPDGFLQAAQEKNLLKGVYAVQGQGLTRAAVAKLLYNYYTAQNGSAVSEDDHTHNYVEKTVSGLGHYMEMNIVETVVVGTEEYWIYQCHGCHTNFDNYDALDWHQDPNNPDTLDRCWDKGSDMYPRKRNITKEVHDYGKRWVNDPDAVIRVCTVCGHEEHTHHYVMTLVDSHPEQVEDGMESYGWYTCTTCGFGSEHHVEVSEHQEQTSHLQSTFSEPRYRPVYKTEWVQNIVRACSVCAEQEP